MYNYVHVRLFESITEVEFCTKWALSQILTQLLTFLNPLPKGLPVYKYRLVRRCFPHYM